MSLGLAACGGNDDNADTKGEQKTTQEAPATTTDANETNKTLIQEAKGAVQALAGGLKKELMAGMKSGGPVAALDVCVTKAPAVSAAVANEKKVDIGRVSLKNRNPDNAPNEWQTTVLNDFEARKVKGEAADTLTYAKTVTTNGKQEFRFMKAIPTGGLCLSCHGDTLAPELAAKIQQHYPDDKATGFKVGDLRGAFYVVKSLD